MPIISVNEYARTVVTAHSRTLCAKPVTGNSMSRDVITAEAVLAYAQYPRLEPPPHPGPVRATEFAPTISPQCEQAATRPVDAPPASGYAPPPQPLPGRWIALLTQTFLSSPMGRCDVRQVRCWFPMSHSEKSMVVCGSSIAPAFAIAARVRNVRSVNGMGATRESRSG